MDHRHVRGAHMHGAHSWNERYARVERLFSREPDAALVEFSDGLQPGRALDLGAGEGRNTLWLARQGWQVTAVDLAEIALERLSTAAEAEGLMVSAVHADMTEYLATAEPVDLVVLAFIHPGPEERARLLAEAAAVVAPGGHLYLSGHHMDSLGLAGPPDPERLYTEDRLAGAFPGLEVLRIERREYQREPEATPAVDVVVWATRRA